MRAVTVGAAYLGVAMRGTLKVGMCSGVAGQTTRVNFLRGSLFKDEDFGFVTAACHMICAWPVAAFAPLMGGAAFRIERRLPVRCLRPIVVAIFVTCLACVRTYVFGIFRRRSSGLCRAAGRATGLVLSSSRLLSLTNK